MNNNQKKELKLQLKNRITTIEKEVEQLTTSCEPVHLDQQAVGRVTYTQTTSRCRIQRFTGA